MYQRSVPPARTLGWFSIGLGLTEVMAPRALARLIGVSDENSMLLRLFGLREVASGVGFLTAAPPRAVDVGARWG